MANWGLIDNATASGPSDLLAEIIAKAQSEDEKKYKRGIEQQRLGIDSRKVGVDEGALGLNRERFGAEQAQQNAAKSEFENIIASAPDWQKPILRLRHAGLSAPLSVADTVMSPQAQHDQAVSDESAKAAAAAKAAAEGRAQTFQDQLTRDKILHGYRLSEKQAPEAGIPSVPINVTGDAALAGLDPNMQRTIKGIANYEVNLPSGMALSKPYWQQVLGTVKAYDPTFDATQYANRQKMRTDFNSGKAAENIRSLNTVVGHIDRLKSVADELSNTSYPWINAAKNFLASKSGSATPNNFDTVRDAVSNELTKVFRGTGGAEADIQAWKSRISSAQSPEQLHGFINEAIGLMDSRLDAMKSQWEKGMGKPADFAILTPESEATLKKLRGNGTAEPAESLPPASHFAGYPPGPYTVKSPSGKDIKVIWDGKTVKGGG